MSLILGKKPGCCFETPLTCLNLQVVVKFISKARIVSDCWVDDPMLGRVSQEIAILTRVQHHNIVKVTPLFLKSHLIRIKIEIYHAEHFLSLCLLGAGGV